MKKREIKRKKPIRCKLGFHELTWELPGAFNMSACVRCGEIHTVDKRKASHWYI